MGAGKSSLVLRFVKGQFLEFQVSFLISLFLLVVSELAHLSLENYAASSMKFVFYWPNRKWGFVFQLPIEMFLKLKNMMEKIGELPANNIKTLPRLTRDSRVSNQFAIWNCRIVQLSSLPYQYFRLVPGTVKCLSSLYLCLNLLENAFLTLFT